jgi:hypothetical protein
MKAIVLEVKGNISAVMKEDGTVVRIPRACEVGETIEVPDKVSVFSAKKVHRIMYMAAAAAVLVLMAGGLYVYQNVLACSYVTMDINPSIEYALNRSERIVSASALNEEAETVVEKLNSSGIRNETISAAVASTMDILSSDGYLGTGDDYMLVSVASPSDRTSESLARTVESAVTEKDSTVKLDVVTATIGDRNAAKGCGISTGRYVLIKEIRAGESSSGNPDESASADSDTEGYAGKSVKELMEDSGWQPGEESSLYGSSADTDTVGGGQGTESDGTAGSQGTEVGGTAGSPEAADPGTEAGGTEGNTGTNPGAEAGTGSGTNPGSNTGTNPGGTAGSASGTTPGIDPGSNPGTNPGTSQGGGNGGGSVTDPGAGQGMDSGVNQGTNQGTNQGLNQGMNQNTNPGTNPAGTADNNQASNAQLG